MAGEPPAGAAGSIPQIDAAASHVWAFVFMAVLMLMFGVGRVAKETKTTVKWKSFLHLWMVAYLVLLAALMSVTTAMALVLMVDEKGQPRITFVPPSFLSMTAAVLGVFGFEFLFRKFIIGFGENQLDLGTTLQNFVDQAVAATLKKEASG
ncbi:MAG TPA: hypothetical protein VG345_11180 [Bryobacteraceae bacterium]|nr:hypothetical protein [Bryobacteraceae bacterium]